MKGSDITTMSAKKTNSQPSEEFIYTQSDIDKIVKEKDLMIKAFSKIAKQPLINLENKKQSILSFQRFSKEKIIQYLQSPQNNIKNIRESSIYMYINSSHYRRLIEYNAKMPLWNYILMPYKYDSKKITKDRAKYLKAYGDIAQYLENMNIKHEFQKISTIALIEDIYYGICWETADSFFMQRINPDWCVLSSIEDGLYNFAIDMSKIHEEDLYLYPPEIKDMWNTYQQTDIRYQEVPVKISACFKMNESLNFSLPIYSGVMTNLHDIEDYKALLKQKTEVANYKLLNMKVPTNKDGEFTIMWDEMLKYYNLLLDVVPEGVGLGMTPTTLDSVDFDKNGGLSDTNEVIKSEQEFWSASGTSPLLFGSGNKSSVSSLKLSIISDEGIMIGFMKQVERWVNRKLKLLNGNNKFKIQILPTTTYNQETMYKMYKESATLGLPVKSMICAINGLEPIDVMAMCDLENDVLKLPKKFIPLSTSYTQSASDGGRPTNESQGEVLTPEGEQTLDDDQNNAR